jgi:hypothetical protein
MYRKGQGDLLSQILGVIIKNQNKNQNIICIAGSIYIVIDMNLRMIRQIDIHTSVPSCPITDYKFLIYDVVIAFIKNNQLDNIGHSNALIIDTKKKNIELFDSAGTPEWTTYIADRIGIEFAVMLPDYRFVNITDFCPVLGPEADLGICGSFSLLYILLRIYNYDLYRENIISILLNLKGQQLIQLMKQFICYMDDLASEYDLYTFKEIFNNIYSYTIRINRDRKLRNALFEVYQNNTDTEALINFAIKNNIPVEYD